MNMKPHIAGLRRRLRRSSLWQVGLIIAFWKLGDLAVQATGLPLPGSIFGMFALLGLLASGRLSVLTVRRGARWFLGEMLLFFVPAVLALLDHPEFLGSLGLRILAVIVLGTVTVMVVTAAFIDLCYRWRVARWEECE